MMRKGIILAGGVGTRLFPLTLVTSKQLLPIYDKPMVYYPLTTLMLAGIREFMVVSTPEDLPRFEHLLGSGEQWGISIGYRVQEEPKGIPEALLICEDFIEGHPSALILGDNFFYGHGLRDLLSRADDSQGATIFAYQVRDPERYGVVEVDEHESPVALYEKPDPAPSRWAITGLYFYPDRVTEVARSVEPSGRGEMEITDVNRHYLSQGNLNCELFYRGFAWMDTGTHNSLHEASTFVQTVQARQGLLIASPEEVAFRMGYIDRRALDQLASALPESSYGSYLKKLSAEGGLGMAH